MEGYVGEEGTCSVMGDSKISIPNDLPTVDSEKWTTHIISFHMPREKNKQLQKHDNVCNYLTFKFNYFNYFGLIHHS